MKKINIVIPMAGLGSRFKDAGFELPKPLISVNDKTLIQHSVDSLGIDGNYIFITRKYENELDNIDLSRILSELVPGSTEIKIDKITSGASETCMYAADYIDNDAPLIITNCDQIINWDSKEFIEKINYLNADGAVVIYHSTDPKNSFAEIKDGFIVKMVEKNAINDNALVGIHYWKHGKDFIESAKNLMSNFKDKGISEPYVSETYNYLINKGKSVIPFFVGPNDYICLGTPEEVTKYLNKIKEYDPNKPKTIFCDIDGTILKHVHSFSHIGKADPQDLPGAINKFNEWDAKGYRIILTTARKESARYITEKHLSDLGFCWDHLIMGVGTGARVLINDKLRDEDKDRAVGINIITDSGFDSIDWDGYDL